MNKHESGLLWGFLIVASGFPFAVISSAHQLHLVCLLLWSWGSWFISRTWRKWMYCLMYMDGGVRMTMGRWLEITFLIYRSPSFLFWKMRQTTNTDFTELLKEFNNAYKWLRVLAYYDVSVNGGFYLCHRHHHLYYCWKNNKHIKLHPKNLWDMYLLIHKSCKREQCGAEWLVLKKMQ